MENNKRMCLNIGDPPMPKDPLNIHVSIMKNMNSSKNPFFNNELWIAVWGFTIKLPETNSSPTKKKPFAAKGKDRPLTIDFQWKTAVKLLGPVLLQQTETRFEEPKKTQFYRKPNGYRQPEEIMLNSKRGSSEQHRIWTPNQPMTSVVFLLSPFWFFRSEHQNLDLLEVVGQNKQYSPKWWFIGDLP